MSVDVHSSERFRHFVIRVSAGARIPDALATTLRDEKVTCGWLRGSGVLTDVELRAYDAEIGALGSTRRIAGTVQVVVLEGAIGLSHGEPSCSLRALIGREGDRGLETLSGEIESARAVALEVFVTALDDLALERALDEGAGVWLLGGASGAAGPPRAASGGVGVSPSGPGRPGAARGGWSAALEASDRVDREPSPRRGPATSSGAIPSIPQRPPRADPDLDAPFPEQGDIVDHFAFGRCEVIKSDGDRLHLRVPKDGRIREIALGMLRVSRLADSDDGRRRFKLERRM